MISKRKMVVGLVFVCVFVVAIFLAVPFVAPTEAAVEEESKVNVSEEKVTNQELISQQATVKSNEAEVIAVSEQESTELSDLECFVTEFANAYFAKDQELVESCLAESFSGEVNTYYAASEDVYISAIKGLSDIRTNDVDTIFVVSVEYKETIDADYFRYLTLEIVKETDDWKVQFYGIEG